VEPHRTGHTAYTHSLITWTFATHRARSRGKFPANRRRAKSIEFIEMKSTVAVHHTGHSLRLSSRTLHEIDSQRWVSTDVRWYEPYCHRRHTHSITLSFSQPHTHTHTLSLSLSLSLIPSHTHTHTHTHTKTSSPWCTQRFPPPTECDALIWPESVRHRTHPSQCSHLAGRGEAG
jgi:hypothetical protein